MKDLNQFIYERKNISVLNRVRIPENRDLLHGVRLNRNERVENFDKKILFNILKLIKKYDLGKYSDPSEIYKILSKYLKINIKNFLITSGIDGSIKSIFEIFTKKNDHIAVLSPTYAMYEIYAKIFNTKLLKVGYKKFKLDKKKLFKIIKYSKVKIIFLPNPNQPIEDNLSIKEITSLCELCKKNKILLVIDEAYHMFGAKTAVNLYKKFNNILILRTFSKSFGVPSIRFGYVVGPEKLIKIFNTYRLSYESNLLSDAVIKYFIKNHSIITNYINKVKQGRDFIKKELIKLDLRVYGKDANFLLIDFNDSTILNKILNKFSKQKIYVKSNYSGELKNCILITCGPVAIMKKILIVIKSIVKK